MVNSFEHRIRRPNSSKKFTVTKHDKKETTINSMLTHIFPQKRCTFGDLTKPNLSYSENPILNNELTDKAEESETETLTDNHLRLSTTERKHDPNWYLGRIHRLCNAGDPLTAMQLFFDDMLIKDRVLPTRNILHVLISGLAHIGDSESAFKVYRKMTELGISATHSTYSRLFKACAEDISAYQRTNRYSFVQKTSNPSVSIGNQYLPPQNKSDFFDWFAGPALKRAKELWQRLHDKGFKLNQVTYNNLLFALANGGDLQACFQALDAMLGIGGLPPPVISPDSLPTKPNTSDALPPFCPDVYTLSAVLIAVQTASKAGLISSVEGLNLALQLWHTILPHLQHGPTQFHFTLLAGIIGLSEPKQYQFCMPTVLKSSKGSVIELCPDKMLTLPLSVSKQPKSKISDQRLFEAKQSASLALTNLSKEMTPIYIQEYVSNVLSASIKQNVLQDSNLSALTNRTAVNPTLGLNWNDKNLARKCPVNLLHKLPAHGFKITFPLDRLSHDSQTTSYPAWQKLALFGGLDGFLHTMTTNFKIKITAPQLFTKLVALLPPPTSDRHSSYENTSKTDISNHVALSDDNKGELSLMDPWETSLLDAMKKYSVPVDLPVLNALILRRTASSQSANHLIALMTRLGLTPDEFTWNCLARTCRNSESVKQFLRTYAKTATTAVKNSNFSVPPQHSLSPVRPSLYIYASLMLATVFYWDSKIVILSSMLGKRPTSLLLNKRNIEKSKNEIDSAPPILDSIAPNRRMIGNLELEIARYRNFIARGLINEDDSGLAPSAKTGGAAIPPYSLKAFKKFLPVYKTWAKLSSIEN